VQIPPSTPALADPAPRTDNFIANEIASRSMGEVLKMASKNSKWEASGADLTEIQKGINVTRIEGTDMASITATTVGSLSGKKIVDSIIQAYLETRKNIEFEMSQKTLDALDNELIAQSDLVQDHRKELTVLIQQYGIPYFVDHTPNPLGQAEVEMFTQARKELAELETKAALTRANLDLPDQDEATRKKFGDQIELLELQIRALSKITDERQDDTIHLSLKQSNYTQAKNQYEQARAMLNEMKQKQQETRVALQIPMTPLIIRQRPN
jgi:hypothetical protein